ncbi:MAG: hypothetical protein IPI49_25505 [Myxococcales bacterium]|jgi:hypothetical protein|nr:hypothetical protein [Myxococcales bacterium]HRC55760.1 hypothetical protein [Kofleriaceae bacterium]
MKLKIKTRGVIVHRELLDKVERMIRAGLGRFEHSVQRAELTVEDINGPRGGIDKVARLQVAGRGFPPILIEQSDREVGRAVTFAVERAARTLVRALKRAQGMMHPARG